VTDDSLVLALRGPGAQQVLDGRDLVHATSDQSWRVREMTAKVVAKHRVDAALEAALELSRGPVLRVRTAAQRAVRELAAAGR
jgi:hypothetical protein